MLYAQEQLNLTETLVAYFGVRSSDMRPLAMYQAHYIAIITMLRSIGHVFHKVDCDTPEKKKWANEKWAIWKTRSVFRDFIDPSRNQLLKEFRGGLTLRTSGMSSPAAVAFPGLPGGTSIVVQFDPDECIGSDEQPIMYKLQEAVSFWKSALAEAETAFKGLGT